MKNEISRRHYAVRLKMTLNVPLRIMIWLLITQDKVGNTIYDVLLIAVTLVVIM